MGAETVRLLVTGATGFIGRHVVERLLREGHDLLLTTTTPDRPFDWDVRTLVFDDAYGGLDPAAIARFAPDALLHLAWAGIPNLDAAWSLTNVAITSRVFATALKAGVARIVGVGSCREYQAGGGRKTESDLPTHHQDVFGQSKTSICKLLRATADESGIEWRWARPFFVYGPGQRPDSLLPAAIAKAAAGGELTVSKPDAAVDFVNVVDVADALYSLSTQAGPSGAFNIGSGCAHNVASAAAWVHREWRGEPTGEILDVTSGEHAWWADITSIERSYGWTPTIPLEDGIRDMMAGVRA